MADKNKNGVDDSKENPKKPFAARQKVAHPMFPFLQGRGESSPTLTRANESTAPLWAEVFNQPVRQGLNFLGDLTSGFQHNKWDSYGTGAGDLLFGVPQGYYADKNANPGFNDTLWNNAFFTDPTPVKKSPKKTSGDGPGNDDDRNPFDQNTPTPSFANALAQAQSILGQYGGGFQPLSNVSYDPLRQDARSRAGEYDAKLQAMYNELQSKIGEDSAVNQANYDRSIADSAARTQTAQGQIQAATQAADQHNIDNLARLGLGNAVENIVAGGRDVNTQASNAVADAAARGQISQDVLGQNKQASADYSQGLQNAAGFSGAEQRARVQTELSSLLADYAMQEQAANQQIAQQNAAGAASQQNGLFSLANSILSNDWKTQGYNDDLGRYLLEQQQNAASQQTPYDPQMAEDHITKLMSATGKSGDDLTALLEQQQLAKKILGY